MFILQKWYHTISSKGPTIYDSTILYNINDIDAYQKGQFSEKTCAAAAGYKFNIINITNQLPVGSNTFIRHWDKSIEDMRERWQLPNLLMKTAQFREQTHNISCTPILNILDIMYPYTTIKTFKENINKYDENVFSHSNMPLEYI